MNIECIVVNYTSENILTVYKVKQFTVKIKKKIFRRTSDVGSTENGDGCQQHEPSLISTCVIILSELKIQLTFLSDFCILVVTLKYIMKYSTTFFSNLYQLGV